MRTPQPRSQSNAQRPVRLTGAAFCVVLLVVAMGCSSSGDKDAKKIVNEEKLATAANGACDVVSLADVNKIFGSDLVVDPDNTSDIECSLLAGDGPEGVTFVIGSVMSQQEFLALVTSDATAVVPNDDNGVKGADESLVWSDSPNIAAGAARVGGATATVRVLTTAPHDDLQQAADVLALIVPKLPAQPFSGGDDSGEALCSAIPVDEVRRAVGSDALEPTPLSDGCAFNDGSGINLIVTWQAGATADQLDIPPTVTNIDGKDYEWKVENIADLADGARWTLNPTDERSGELIALFGERLVRVASSANEPGPELKARAIAVARVAGAVGT